MSLFLNSSLQPIFWEAKAFIAFVLEIVSVMFTKRHWGGEVTEALSKFTLISIDYYLLISLTLPISTTNRKTNTPKYP